MLNRGSHKTNGVLTSVSFKTGFRPAWHQLYTDADVLTGSSRSAPLLSALTGPF